MLLTVGRVVRPHGVRGEVLVEIRTDEPEQRYAPGSVLTTSSGSRQVPPEVMVEAARTHQGRLIVGFQGVADRTAAEAMRGVLLHVDSGEVPSPEDPEEYHDHQLVGLAAVSPGGEALGEVAGIDHAPAADLLVVRRPGGRTALVPFVAAIVREVEPAGGRIVIDPPPGLFDL